MSASLEYVPTRFVAARLQGQHGRELDPSVVAAVLRRIGAGKAKAARSNKSRAAMCTHAERFDALRTAMGAA